MSLTINEILGWITSLLTTLGLIQYLHVYLLIGIAAALLYKLLDR